MGADKTLRGLGRRADARALEALGTSHGRDERLLGRTVRTGDDPLVRLAVAGGPVPDAPQRPLAELALAQPPALGQKAATPALNGVVAEKASG